MKNQKSKIITLLFILTFITNSYAFNLSKIKTYVLSGDYKAAITEGEKILASSGYSEQLDELYYILGLSYLKDGNYLRASDIFEIILKEFPKSTFKVEAKLGLGDSYFLRGDFEQAKNRYNDLLNSKYKAAVYYRLSQIELKQGNSEAAKEYLAKIKNDAPLNPEVRLNKDLYVVKSKDLGIFYTVQVGSFANETNAVNLTQKLTQGGYAAYLEESVSPAGDKAYKVRVGKLYSRQEAEALEKKLSQEGHPTKIFP